MLTEEASERSWDQATAFATILGDARTGLAELREAGSARGEQGAASTAAVIRS